MKVNVEFDLNNDSDNILYFFYLNAKNYYHFIFELEKGLVQMLFDLEASHEGASSSEIKTIRKLLDFYRQEMERMSISPYSSWKYTFCKK